MVEDTETTETNEVSNTTETSDPTLETALKKIDELQQTMVSRDDYNKVVEENKKLIDAVSNKREPVKEEINEEEVAQRIIERSKKQADSKNLSGLEFCELLMDNNDDMRKIGIDPYDGCDENTRAAMETVEEEIKKAIKDSKGSPSLFASILDTTFPDKSGKGTPRFKSR